MRKVIKVIVERISQMMDYFVVLEKVTLSEVSMLGIAFIWFIWFALFDVAHSTISYKYIYSQESWAGIFGLLVIAHVVGLLQESLRLRGIITRFYALAWLVWMFILGGSAPGSQIFPTVMGLMIINVVLSVRLAVERKMTMKIDTARNT